MAFKLLFDKLSPVMPTSVVLDVSDIHVIHNKAAMKNDLCERKLLQNPHLFKCDMRFEFVAVVLLRMQVFRNVTLYHWADHFHHFRDIRSI